MTQPLDRNARIKAIGAIDENAGEFWVENPFDIASSGYNLSAYERNRAFLNVDGDSFLDASFASTMDIDADSRSVVTADFDRDGAPDVLIVSVGGGPVRLFLNRFPPVQRVRVDLVGQESTRAGIGARVVAEAGGQTIRRTLFPTNGGFGQGPAELDLGLGSASVIDRLTVTWPSGQQQVFRDVPGNGVLRVTEGDPDLVQDPFRNGRP